MRLILGHSPDTVDVLYASGDLVQIQKTGLHFFVFSPALVTKARQGIPFFLEVTIGFLSLGTV